MSPASVFKARERLILALDFASAPETSAFLSKLNAGTPADMRLLWVKVGLELFLAEGPSLLERLQAEGYQVFLDLKLHDIPNTVAGAVRSVLRFKPALLTVHASGGTAMLTAAAAAAAGSSTRLLAVTVLTSMDVQQLAATGLVDAAEDQVIRLARLAEFSGVQGLVCSAREAALLRELIPTAHLVTPGIRPAGASIDDQHRVSTPAQAIECGASQLVIGRPITAAKDPAAAYLAILQEMAAVL